MSIRTSIINHIFVFNAKNVNTTFKLEIKLKKFIKMLVIATIEIISIFKIC